MNSESQPPSEDEAVQLEGRAARKAEEAKVAGMYAKEELRAAKIRLRKVNRAKKHRKKKRQKEGEAEDTEGDENQDGV